MEHGDQTLIASELTGSPCSPSKRGSDGSNGVESLHRSIQLQFLHLIFPLVSFIRTISVTSHRRPIRYTINVGPKRLPNVHTPMPHAMALHRHHCIWHRRTDLWTIAGFLHPSLFRTASASPGFHFENVKNPRKSDLLPQGR